MAESALVFEGITEEKYARLTAKAREAGVAIEGASGRASRMGVEIEWNYAANEQRLTLKCLGKPFFVGMDEVYKRLRATVEESLA